MNISKRLLYLFFLVNFMLCSTVSALEGDSVQPITVDSDAGFYDEKKGLSIYTGDVVVIQGSMRLGADKLVVYLENREIQKMVATGRPVKFRQTPEAGKEDVHGNSLTAEYFPETKLLILLESAVVWQGENSTKSERIEYDRLREVLKAGDTTSTNKRVHVILQPKSKAD
ncbi:MAG: lipopolysaccharide export system protein LptA [Methyloprofundus sp.]|nr:MAG: lipopolysaccharide export system protein LptA [Methyloprofundus sp.]